MLAFRLTLRQLLVRRTRTALTVLAIAFAVSLVVAVTSGFASLRAVATRLVDRYQGSTDVFITARDVSRTTFAASVLDDVHADPRVKKAIGRFETTSPLLDTKGNVIIGRPAALIGIVPDQDNGGANLRIVSGKWFEGDSRDGAVLNSNTARRIKTPEGLSSSDPSLKVGDTFTLPGPSGPLTLKVAAIVHQPEIAGFNIYVPLETLRTWALRGRDVKPQLTRIMVELRDGKDLAAFEQDWLTRLKAVDPSIRVRLARTNKEQLEKNLMSLELLSAVAVSISLISAACIVFSTLSMGVTERQRQLAMLRAIGATRGLVARLVVAEGLLLAGGGVLLGAPLGWVWVKALTLFYAKVFTEGVVFSLPGLVYSFSACVGTALAATLFPAFQATRVSPLEAMAPLAGGGGSTWPWRTALAGLLCCAVSPLGLSGLVPFLLSALKVADAPSLARGIQFWSHYILGVPLTMLGFFLLAPITVRLVEAALVPLAARVMSLPTALLRQQLAGGDSQSGGGGAGGGIWRAAGTACALMVGLASLVVMQTQGHSALGAWRLPTKFPDVFILHRGTGGLDAAQVDKLAHLPGIKPGELMPVAIASPTFGNNFLAIAGAAALPESTLFFGVDPDQARNMTELEFRQGDPDTATAEMKKGRHVLITEEYRQIRNVGVGDTLELRTRTRTQGNVKFTIAGVVWSPGIDVIVSLFDLGGSFDQRTAYSVFGTLQDAREYFGVNEISVFAANLEGNVEREELTKRLQQEVGKLGLQAFDIRHIKAQIQDSLGNLLLMASSIAFAAMFVASLGVTNTIMASIRSRRWQFGVLRAVGVTRDQLTRLVLAESLLLAVAAIALGLACGTMLTFSGRQALRLFIGFVPPVVIPWTMLGVGVSVVLAVAIVATIYPARTTSNKPVLDLLQSGRASA